MPRDRIFGWSIGTEAKRAMERERAKESDSEVRTKEEEEND